MNTIGERIKFILKENGIKVITLAEIIGKKQTSISSYIINRAYPSGDFFIAIKKLIPTLNLNWLITGEEPIYNNEEMKTDVVELKVRLQHLESREKQLTDTIIRMGSMLPTGSTSTQQGDRSKYKGVFNSGNCRLKHTVINTPWFA